MQAGPCLKHCYRCSPRTAMAARVALVYAFACAFYVIATRSLGTPFADSLSDSQREVKRRSAQTRGRIFALGIVVGILATASWSPFRR